MKRWGAVFAVLLCGCPAQTEQGRLENAFRKTVREVSDGVTRAERISGDQDQYETVVRYNPATCKCPPFEIFAYGRWMRVLFTGDEGALNGLAEFQTREKQSPSLRTYTVRGRFTDDTELAENEVAYPSFALELAQ